MKIKTFLFTSALVISLGTLAVSAQTIDSSGWYVYNGTSTAHSFSIKFPTDWQAKTFGNVRQGFAPSSNIDNILFTIQEFEGKTMSQAVNSYLDETTAYVRDRDFVLETDGEDLIAKEVIFQDLIEKKEYSLTFIKRGSLIVALTSPNIDQVDNFPTPNQYQETIKGMIRSFRFTDNWHLYIDFEEKYSFIFPSNFKINNLDNGVEVYDSSQVGDKFFKIQKFPGIGIDKVAENYASSRIVFENKKDIFFHGIEPAITATYLNKDDGKKFSIIFIQNGNTSYALTNINIEPNYPHLNFYEDYLVEILESLEFFEVAGEYHGYRNFIDVRTNHPNANSIDNLTAGGVINGYPDGTFKPNGEINRAELTKMIVETVADPTLAVYSDCFPDVTNQWFAPHICYAEKKGWVEGYEDGTFKPENNVNRVEAIKIVMEVLFSKEISTAEKLANMTTKDINLNDWYAKYFIFADNKKLLDKQHIKQEGGLYYFFPSNNMTRKEVAEMIYRSMALSKILN